MSSPIMTGMNGRIEVVPHLRPTGLFTYIVCFGWLRDCFESFGRKRQEYETSILPPEAWEVRFNKKGNPVDWQLKEEYRRFL